MKITSKEWFPPFPDYLGEEMTIIDACPTRSEVQVHKAVRTLKRQFPRQISLCPGRGRYREFSRKED
jgi:hypothetical protein